MAIGMCRLLLFCVLGAACAVSACTGQFGQPKQGATGGSTGGSGSGSGTGGSGTGGSGGGSGSSGGSGSGGSTGGVVSYESPLRRLDSTEVTRETSALLNLTLSANSLFPVTPIGKHAFSTYTELNTLDGTMTRAIHRWAEAVADEATTDANRLVGCDAADERCVSGFVDALMRRAFRRNPTAEERAAVWAAYQGSTGSSTSQRISVVVRAVLQSPQFLLLDLRGQNDPERPGIVQLDQHTLAARLGFLLWRQVDPRLQQLADEGNLTKQAIQAEAARMLDDDRFVTGALRDFHRSLFEIDGLMMQSHLDPVLVSEMHEELDRFVTHVWNSTGTFKELLTSQATSVNAKLRGVYGIQAASAGWQLITRPATRPGVLTLASVAAAHQGPIKRGMLLLKQLQWL